MGRAARTLSVVMPAYQLADVIEPNISAVFEALSELDPQVIVVDDGSTDGTFAAIERAAAARTSSAWTPTSTFPRTRFRLSLPS